MRVAGAGRRRPSGGERRGCRRWFVPSAWRVHRALVRLTRGPRMAGRDTAVGALRLTTTGRRSGRQRSVVLGYLEDGPNLVTLAMNGWGEGEPAWWLNLQAQPRAEAQLKHARCDVVGRAATGPERDRLWDRWRQLDPKLDAYAARRSTPTAVVLEPRLG